MAKTLLHFEGRVMNAFSIEKIESFERYNTKEDHMEYGIIINKNIPDSMNPLVDMEIVWPTQEIREKKYEELRLRLESIENVVFI